MHATIQPGLIAAMVGIIHDARCRRASFLARDGRFTVMAATKDKSVLFNGSIPSTITKEGGFTLTEEKFNFMRSPSMSTAQVTFDQDDGIAKVSYGKRRYFEEVTQFKGTRHPAMTLRDKQDAEATVDSEELIDAVYEPDDKEEIDFKIAGGRVTVAGAGVKGTNNAVGSASGRYRWEPIACMLNGCQHADSLAIHMKDKGALTIVCTDSMMFGVRILHV